MPKDPSPLLGYNNNIRHKNRVFHVQTEDSGVRHPHIITHLFMDGGRILKSVKTSYAEHLGAERMADLVRKMMKDQHKGMLIALRDGQFDTVIDGGDASMKPAPPAAVAAAPIDDALVLSPMPDAVAAAPIPLTADATIPDGIEVEPIAAVAAPQGESIDVGALERAAADDQSSSLFDPPRDMQPPPANLFKPRTGGNYSAIVDAEPEILPPRSERGVSRPAPRGGSSSPPGAVISKSTGLRPGSAPPPLRRTSSPAPPPASRPPAKPARRPEPAAAAAKPAESRYAPARPAAIFGQARPRSGNSIFGEDIISDKSLDEVILSYLAEDGDGPARESSKPASARPDPKRRK